MKIKKEKTYDIMDLIGALERIKEKVLPFTIDGLAKRLDKRFSCDIYEGTETLLVVLKLNNKNNLELTLKIREYDYDDDDKFYTIKDIKAEII